MGKRAKGKQKTKKTAKRGLPLSPLLDEGSASSTKVGGKELNQRICLHPCRLYPFVVIRLIVMIMCTYHFLNSFQAQIQKALLLTFSGVHLFFLVYEVSAYIAAKRTTSSTCHKLHNFFAPQQGGRWHSFLFMKCFFILYDIALCALIVRGHAWMLLFSIVLSSISALIQILDHIFPLQFWNTNKSVCISESSSLDHAPESRIKDNTQIFEETIEEDKDEMCEDEPSENIIGNTQIPQVDSVQDAQDDQSITHQYVKDSDSPLVRSIKITISSVPQTTQTAQKQQGLKQEQPPRKKTNQPPLSVQSKTELNKKSSGFPAKGSPTKSRTTLNVLSDNPKVASAKAVVSPPAKETITVHSTLDAAKSPFTRRRGVINARTSKRNSNSNGVIISKDIDATISILSSSIPRPVISEAKSSGNPALGPDDTESGGIALNKEPVPSIKLQLELDDGEDSVDTADVFVSGKLEDLDKFNQYGTDNVVCIGAAAVCKTPVLSIIPQYSAPKNIISPLFAFTNTPTEDIVRLPHAFSQTNLKNISLPSVAPIVTLSDHDMLILAAKSSDVTKIETYKQFSGKHDSAGMFALAYCVLQNNVDGVKILLSEAKMRTNKSMKFHETDYVDVDALMLSVLADSDPEIIKLLIPLSDICQDGYSQRTALMMAAALGNDIAVQLLAESQGNQTTPDGRTALMMAAEFGQDKCVSILMEKTSEVCRQSKMGWTALCFAADNGHAKCVEVLAPKESMMFILYSYDRRSSSGLIMNFMSGTALMLAAWHGSAECVALLKDVEAKIQTHKYENTALIFAATAGHVECVKLLMNLEAKMRDSFGRTALMKAATENNIECVKILAPIEHGLVDEWGSSALVFAAKKDNLACVNILAPYEAKKSHTCILNRNWCSPVVEKIVRDFSFKGD